MMDIKKNKLQKFLEFADYSSPFMLGGIVWIETGSLGYGLVVQFALTTLVCIKRKDTE